MKDLVLQLYFMKIRYEKVDIIYLILFKSSLENMYYDNVLCIIIRFYITLLLAMYLLFCGVINCHRIESID